MIGKKCKVNGEGNDRRWHPPSIPPLKGRKKILLDYQVEPGNDIRRKFLSNKYPVQP